MSTPHSLLVSEVSVSRKTHYIEVDLDVEVLYHHVVSQKRVNRCNTILNYMDWLDANFKKRKERLEEGSTSHLHIF